MAKKVLTVKPAVFRSLNELLKGARKIQAIKVLRAETGAGLREAKLAIDNLGHDLGIGASWPRNGEAVVVPVPYITKVTIRVGLGEAEVDLEEAEFLIMKELGNVPLEEMRKLLSLVEILNKYSMGEDFKNV